MSHFAISRKILLFYYLLERKYSFIHDLQNEMHIIYICIRSVMISSICGFIHTSDGYTLRVHHIIELVQPYHSVLVVIRLPIPYGSRAKQSLILYEYMVGQLKTSP